MLRIIQKDPYNSGRCRYTIGYNTLCYTHIVRDTHTPYEYCFKTDCEYIRYDRYSAVAIVGICVFNFTITVNYDEAISLYFEIQKQISSIVKLHDAYKLAKLEIDRCKDSFRMLINPMAYNRPS
jgi:hypothetical protein